VYRAKVQYLLRNHRERLLSAAPSVFSLVMRLACKIQSEVIEANVLYRSYWVGNPATGFWVNSPIWAFYLRLACRAVTGMLADLSV
jgi:hypothetical protein